MKRWRLVTHPRRLSQGCERRDAAGMGQPASPPRSSLAGAPKDLSRLDNKNFIIVCLFKPLKHMKHFLFIIDIAIITLLNLFRILNKKVDLHTGLQILVMLNV